MSAIDTNKLTPLPTQGRENSPIAECRWYNAGQQAHSHSHRICNGCALGNRSGMLLRVTDRPVIIHSDGRKFYGDVVRSAGNRALTIEETDLTYIRIDHQARLQFGQVEIVIECPFVLTVADTVHRLDPEARIELGPLLALYPASLSAAYVSEQAALHLDFDGGATVVVPQNAQYEAWQVHDDKGWLLACQPGSSGEMAEWARS